MSESLQLDPRLVEEVSAWQPKRLSDFQGNLDALVNFEFVSICARYDKSQGIFDAGEDPFLFLPQDRSLWEEKAAQKLKFSIENDDDLYWPYASGGLLVLVKDSIGQVTAFLEYRGPKLKRYPNSWNIPLGFPRCTKGDTTFFAEQLGLADSAMREVIEEVIIVDRGNNRLIPDIFLQTENNKPILAKIIAINHELISQFASRFALAYPEKIKPVKSYFLELPGEKQISLKFQRKTWNRYGRLVFGTKSQNLDIVRVLVMEFDGRLEDLVFYDGEAQGKTNQPLNLEVGLGMFDSEFHPILNDNNQIRIYRAFKSGCLMPADTTPHSIDSTPALATLLDELQSYWPS